MAYLVELETFTDDRGSLTVLDKELPFAVKRAYYIYNAVGVRAGHRHKINTQALVCLGGSCEVFVNDGKEKNTYLLDSSDKCLILNPEDWHTMDKFSDNSILLVLASEHYDVNEYIDEEYP